MGKANNNPAEDTPIPWVHVSLLFGGGFLLILLMSVHYPELSNSFNGIAYIATAGGTALGLLKWITPALPENVHKLIRRALLGPLAQRLIVLLVLITVAAHSVLGSMHVQWKLNDPLVSPLITVSFPEKQLPFTQTAQDGKNSSHLVSWKVPRFAKAIVKLDDGAIYDSLVINTGIHATLNITVPDDFHVRQRNCLCIVPGPALVQRLASSRDNVHGRIMMSIHYNSENVELDSLIDEAIYIGAPAKVLAWHLRQDGSDFLLKEGNAYCKTHEIPISYDDRMNIRLLVQNRRIGSADLQLGDTVHVIVRSLDQIILKQEHIITKRNWDIMFLEDMQA